MKREPSPVTRSLRAASLVITLVSIVAFTTVAYSFYTDVTAVVGALGSSNSKGVSTSTVVNGTTAIVSVNATVPNPGLYPVSVSIFCLPSNGTVHVTCSNSGVTVPPGTSQTLRFTMALSNLSSTAPNRFTIDGNISLSLVPFGSVSIVKPIAAGGS